MDFANKVAVVTGGASGIGLATAKQLAARGAHLVLVDMQASALGPAARAVEAVGKGRVETRVCDVSNHAAMLALADDVVKTLGGVHIVFNNAGVAVGGPISEMSHDDWRWIIDVDLWGPIHGVEAFLPHMKAAKAGGHILFTASFAGLVPNVGLGPYCVAKYGVVALAEVLHRELRDDDIGVSVLCPMRVGTNIGTSERNRDGRYGGARNIAARAGSGRREQRSRRRGSERRRRGGDGGARDRRKAALHPAARREPAVHPPPLRADRSDVRTMKPVKLKCSTARSKA